VAIVTVLERVADIFISWYASTLYILILSIFN
jgi:hypothetical protein